MHGFGLLRRGALPGVLGCLAAVGLAIPTTAAAKVTSLTSCQAITSPGKYRLDAGVTAPPGSDCFDITAGGVTLSLNGHTVTGSGGDVGIDVNGSGVKIVGPGTVSGFGNGIVLEGGDGSVRGVTVTGNDAQGIELESSGNDVRGNVATDNFFGIAAGLLGTGNTIIGNYAHGNSNFDLFDLHSNCDSNVWRGNDFGIANQSCIH
jgi:parallel beta-helix repeat protein